MSKKSVDDSITEKAWLKGLFDFQLFENNPKLERVIFETVDAYEHDRELSEEELDLWAAGDTSALYLTSKEEDD